MSETTDKAAPDPLGGEIESSSRRKMPLPALGAVVLLVGIIVGWVIATGGGDQRQAPEATPGTDAQLSSYIAGEGGVGTAADEGFEAEFPIRPTRVAEDVGNVSVTNYSASAGSEVYSVIVFEYPAGEPIPEDLGVLAEIVAGQNSTKVSEVSELSLGDRSVEYLFDDGEGGYQKGRYIFIDRTLYQLAVTSDREEPLGWEVFVESFSFESSGG